MRKLCDVFDDEKPYTGQLTFERGLTTSDGDLNAKALYERTMLAHNDLKQNAGDFGVVVYMTEREYDVAQKLLRGETLQGGD